MSHVTSQDAGNSLFIINLPSAEEQPPPAFFLGVMVPVLSRQSISTRARVSTEYISCTKTFFKPNLITAVKSEVMVKRAIPLGNIPSRAVDEFTTDDLRGKPFKSKASSKRARPKRNDNLPSKTC